MKSLTTSSDCLVCNECCIFESDELYFSPLCTHSEVRKIIKNYPKYNIYFIKNKKDKDVYQIKLVKSIKKSNKFVCPFYNENTNLCQIYLHRPFDCQLWPIMIVKGKINNIYKITIAQKNFCSVLQKTSNIELNKFYKYIVKTLNTEKYKKIYHNHRELALPEESWMVTIGYLDAT